MVIIRKSFLTMINIKVCYNTERVNPSFYLKFNVAVSVNAPTNTLILL